ncbi:MAG: TIGR02186 family protein [Pseudorhodobacter sp.]
MIRLVFIILYLATLPARAETIIAGLSQDQVSITTDFTGSEILIYGAVKREEPIPAGTPLEIVITVEGPSGPVIVRKKARRFGIWVNTENATIRSAPSFYAIASSAPLAEALSETENLRYQVTIPRAIRAVGISAEVTDSPRFLDALVRIKEAEGNYIQSEGAVSLVEQTLFRADISLPANLVEGDYQVRFFITRNGRVVDYQERAIFVQKAGFERWLFNLAHENSLIYGLMALVLAGLAGWGASAIFGLMRR